MPLYPVSGLLCFNVKDYGATGSGATDDSAAIQAAITAAQSAGRATVFFPAGTYLVGSTIQLAEKLHYLGEVSDEGYIGTTIKQANAANLDAVLASTSWYTNQSVVGYGFVIEHITVDGNKANQTSGIGLGLVSMNYNTYIRRCTVINSRSHGIVLASVNRTNWGGNTTISNTMIQCYIEDCTVAFAGGCGILVNDPIGNKNTDHFICNNIVHDCAQHGINCNAAGGTLISGNHTYSTQWCGISTGSCFGTRIIDNYVDGYGLDTSQPNLEGLQAYCIGTLATIISGNVITALEPGASTFYYHVYVAATDAANPVFIQISNNHVTGNFSGNPSGNASHSNGFVFDMTGNQVSGGNTATYISSGNTATNCGTSFSRTGNSLARYLHYEDAAGNLQLAGALAVGQSALTTLSANASSVSTSGVGLVRLTTNNANYTGNILQAGIYPGQEVWVVNEHATNTIAWAAQATSNIAGEAGGTFVLGAKSAQHFVWNSSSSLWYKTS